MEQNRVALDAGGVAVGARLFRSGGGTPAGRLSPVGQLLAKALSTGGRNGLAGPQVRGGSRNELAQLQFPPVSRHHPRRISSGLPHSSAAPVAGEAAGHLGSFAPAPGVVGNRICRHRWRPAVGLSETLRPAQLLSR
jgi:hypothetical protein